MPKLSDADLTCPMLGACGIYLTTHLPTELASFSLCVASAFHLGYLLS